MDSTEWSNLIKQKDALICELQEDLHLLEEKFSALQHETTQLKAKHEHEEQALEARISEAEDANTELRKAQAQSLSDHKRVLGQKNEELSQSEDRVQDIQRRAAAAQKDQTLIIEKKDQEIRLLNEERASQDDKSNAANTSLTESEHDLPSETHLEPGDGQYTLTSEFLQEQQARIEAENRVVQAEEESRRLRTHFDEIASTSHAGSGTMPADFAALNDENAALEQQVYALQEKLRYFNRRSQIKSQRAGSRVEGLVRSSLDKHRQGSGASRSNLQELRKRSTGDKAQSKDLEDSRRRNLQRLTTVPSGHARNDSSSVGIPCGLDVELASWRSGTDSPSHSSHGLLETDINAEQNLVDTAISDALDHAPAPVLRTLQSPVQSPALSHADDDVFQNQEQEHPDTISRIPPSPSHSLSSISSSVTANSSSSHRTDEETTLVEPGAFDTPNTKTNRETKSSAEQSNQNHRSKTKRHSHKSSSPHKRISTPAPTGQISLNSPKAASFTSPNLLQSVNIISLIVCFILTSWSWHHQSLAQQERDMWRSANDMSRQAAVLVRQAHEHGVRLNWLSVDVIKHLVMGGKR